MVYQTAYDTFPLQTRAWKQESLRDIADTQALLLLCHDPTAAGVRVVADSKREFLAQDPWVPTGFQP